LGAECHLVVHNPLIATRQLKADHKTAWDKRERLQKAFDDAESGEKY